MATSAEKVLFINEITPVIQKYAAQYGYKCSSPIIAQAIIESGWGKSILADKYHNYFGLKCGSYWKGGSVNMRTSEEYTPGTYTNISANFRTYSTLDEGVKGYFVFISTKRYANLKTMYTPEEYLTEIKRAGYATSSTYVDSNMWIVNNYNLEQYDKDVVSDSMNRIVNEVIAGQWGNGHTRKVRLTDAGYDYQTIQDIINSRYASYYLLYNGYSTSIVDALKDVGCYDTRFTARRKIAHKNGIKVYRGSTAQNTHLLDLLKQGKLMKA